MFLLIAKNYANLSNKLQMSICLPWLNSAEYKVYQDFTHFYELDIVKSTAMFRIITDQFVIFNSLSYCFEEMIGFDVKTSFVSRSVSRLIR